MFTRAAARSALRASMPAQRRMIQTTPVRATAAVAPTHTSDDESLMSKYGMYPLVGLATTAMVSKEVIILSEETLIAINFSAFCLAAYVAAGTKLNDAFDIERKENEDKVLGATNFRVKLIEAEIAQWEASKNTMDAFTAIADQNAAVAGQYTNAVQRQAKQEAAAKARSALEALANQQKSVQMEAQANLVADAADYARGQFATPTEAMKDAAIWLAIDGIGFLKGEPKATDVDADPVKKVFMDYVKLQEGQQVKPFAQAAGSSWGF